MSPVSKARVLRIAVAGGLLVGSVAFAAPVTAAAATCSSGVAGDVNGDGYAEVAVAEGGRPNNTGAVHVFYGRAKGLAASASGKALNDQYLDQETSGVAGSGQDQDQFGSALAFGDYNDDGCADLAVGATSDAPAGTVYVFYGSTSGLRTSGSTRIANAEVFGPPGPLAERGFGGVLAAGDLNDDGVADLAVSGPANLPGTDGHGAVGVLFGGNGGLSPARKAVVNRNSAHVDEDESIGGPMATGDFDGDGVGELAFGAGAGQLQIVEGTKGGLVPTRATPLTGPSLGVDDLVVGDDGEPDSRVFGEVIAVGDVNADGSDDLAVGMNRLEQGGVVVLVRGSAQGLTSAGLQTWTQDSPGVAGTVEEDRAFGTSLAMGRLDSDPTDDLAIGVPGDAVGSKIKAGSVTILLGSSAGLTTAGAGGTRFHQDTAGIAGSAEAFDDLGRTVAIANVQSKTQGSLIFGAPREKVGKLTAAGQFHQLSISATGPKASGSVTLHLDSSGVRGDSRKEAEFGRTLS